MSSPPPRLLENGPYVGYSYAYPHKTAYRRLDPPVSLAEAWRPQREDALFAYVHIPFCEMRCGFCNLFTTPVPSPDLVDRYLAAVDRQARVIRGLLPDATFARFAVGGGTPTYLTVSQLERVFRTMARLGIAPARTAGSVETSPDTATSDRLALLRDVGVQRISIGVQTMLDEESRRLGRSQSARQVQCALDRLISVGFPCLNVDLIYGIEGQTLDSWMQTVRGVLAYRPQELYLYPLYVRPLTALWKARSSSQDVRLDAYREARALLLSHGYEQASMRMFRLATSLPDGDVAYCCQRDGMIGLGCGARSYTQTLHYSTEYSMTRSVICKLVDQFAGMEDAAFATAWHGIHLDREEQVRRFVIKSLLRAEGLDCAQYRDLFGTEAVDDLPQLCELIRRELAAFRGERLRLTPPALERSDEIGPWLYSAKVKHLSETYEWH